ncbi:MAG: C39 family peptidase [Verrucomicrobiales bacterium]|nr:C39 family peptidase [Verrucomicrobiales bacterium]
MKLAISVFVVLVFSSAVRSQEFKFDADLDPFISLPGAYKLNPESLGELFKQGDMRQNPYFEWLSSDKRRAIFKRYPASNVEVDLTILKGTVPIQEMIVDFKDNRFLGVTISIFNRGDAGKLERDDFESYFKGVGRHLGKQLAARPNRRVGNIKRGLLTSGYTWISGRGMAVLEYNPGVMSENRNVEFLRMRLCRREAGGSYAASMQERAAATVRQSELPRNVVKDTNSGDVYVSEVPMVDQGGKGYCVVASVQRLFEYYGVPCDMHQLAEIAGANPRTGTSSFETNKQLGSIDHLFKMRYSCLGIMSQRGDLREMEDPEKGYLGEIFDGDDFDKAVRKYTDAGIPLLWSLEVGRFQEEPPISEQASGGHMRLIIGYNDEKDRILFSDSWGAGHELKSMGANDAYKATRGLFLMKPVTN